MPCSARFNAAGRWTTRAPSRIEHRELAIAALGCIPESEFRHNLLTITDLAVDRQA